MKNQKRPETSAVCVRLGQETKGKLHLHLLCKYHPKEKKFKQGGNGTQSIITVSTAQQEKNYDDSERVSETLSQSGNTLRSENDIDSAHQSMLKSSSNLNQQQKKMW